MFKLSKNRKVAIVAEISANHGQNFKHAVSLIKKAKECGADSVKFQAYTPDTLTINADNKYFKIRHPQWGGQSLYQLYQKAYTPWSWFKELKKITDDLGMMFFATSFDKTAVDFLEDLNVKVHKISSFELVDLPLIEYAAKTGKPLVISTGMATLNEIKEAVSTAKNCGAAEVVLLKCVSNYPADPGTMNLKVIPDMKKRFQCPVGLSDHTLGIGVSLAAVALGAVLVEKHFTSSRKRNTPDSFFSIEPEELKNLVGNIRLAEMALGNPSYAIDGGQKESRAFRRSLFAVNNIKRGDIFSEDNIRSIRPAQGLKPKYFGKILGKKARKNIKRGAPLRWDMISG